jgi:uncharacterized membrane protein YccF (DUF307 family)
MMSSAEAKIQLAYQLLEEDRLNEARETLLGVDHPAARELEQYIIDSGYFEKAKRSIPVAPPQTSPYAPIQQYPPYAQPYNGQPVIVYNDHNPNLLTQILWFVFVGSWASQLAILAAYFMIATIVLMPFGVMILNRIPAIMTLRSPKKQLVVTEFNGATVLSVQDNQQINFFLRALYFLFVGWWATLLVVELAWLFAFTLIGLPISFMLFNSIPAVISLKR